MHHRRFCFHAVNIWHKSFGWAARLFVMAQKATITGAVGLPQCCAFHGWRPSVGL